MLDDSHDEGEETLTLTLSNASGGRLTDAFATGTIENTDLLPRALMARFGRPAALHVVEQVQERIEAPREAGFEAQFARQRQLRPGMVRDHSRAVRLPRDRPGWADRRNGWGACPEPTTG